MKLGLNIKKNVLLNIGGTFLCSLNINDFFDKDSISSVFEMHEFILRF